MTCTRTSADVTQGLSADDNVETNLEALHHVCKSSREQREEAAECDQGLHPGLKLSDRLFSTVLRHSNATEGPQVNAHAFGKDSVCVCVREQLHSPAGDPGRKPAFKCDFCSPFTSFVLCFYLTSQHVIIGGG